MLRDECVENESTWAPEASTDTHREIDRQLHSIAKRRAGLDVEEARWLRDAEKHRVWRKLGFSTALELTFVRDGRVLGDSASLDRAPATRSRFDDAITLERAKEALVQLGYKRRAAREALVEVTAHVKATADVATLVRAVLSRASK